MLRQDTIDIVSFNGNPSIKTTCYMDYINSCEFDCNEWNWLPNFRLSAVIKIFKIEKFLIDFLFSSTSLSVQKYFESAFMI